MNARLKLLRERIKDSESKNDNNNFNKRKREEEKESEPPMKRRNVVISNSPNRIEDTQTVQKSWDRQPSNEPSSKRYSANNRLLKIRRNIEQSKQAAEEPQPQEQSVRLHDKIQSDKGSSSSSARSGFSPGMSSNQKNTVMPTAKASSLEERLSQFKNSTNTSKSPFTSSSCVEHKNKNRFDKRSTSSNTSSKNLSLPHISDSENDNQTGINRSTDECGFSSKDNNSTLSDVSVNSENSFSNNVVADNTKSSSSSSISKTTSSIRHSSEDDAMDWDDCEEKEVVSNLQEMRKNHNIASTVPLTSFQKSVANRSTEIQHNYELFKTTYIVVDTNVFLSQLETVKKAMKLRINGTNIGVSTPIVFVPWMVIQELDYIKDGKHNIKLKDKAQQAIHFINNCLSNKLNLKGQSVRDAAQQDFTSSNFDDSILHCCLQIRERRNRAILLSNDVNLRNKLMNEDIEAFGQDKIFKRLDPYHLSFPKSSTSVKKIVQEDEVITEIKTRLRHLCTFVIIKELREAYGELWSKMGSAKRPLPWSVQDCLDLFETYWMPVFQMNLPRQCLKLIQDFREYLKSQNELLDDGELLDSLGLGLCVYLKNGYPCYAENIEDCIKNLSKTKTRTNR